MEQRHVKKVRPQDPTCPHQKSPRTGQGRGWVATTIDFGRELPPLACTDPAHSLRNENTLLLPALRRPKKPHAGRGGPMSWYRAGGVRWQPVHCDTHFLLGAQSFAALANCTQQSCRLLYLLLVLPVFISLLLLLQAVMV